MWMMDFLRDPTDLVVICGSAQERYRIEDAFYRVLRGSGYTPLSIGTQESPLVTMLVLDRPYIIQFVAPDDFDADALAHFVAERPGVRIVVSRIAANFKSQYWQTGIKQAIEAAA